MSVSADLSNSIINRAWTEAATLLGGLDSRLDTAQSSVSGSVTVGVTTVPSIGAIDEPSVLIPYEAEGPNLTVFNEFNTALKNDLVNLFSDFLTTYFPLDAATLGMAETKLQELLTTGGVAVNTTVEAQIWERDRSRILSDATRAVDEIASTWAAKGFPVPPGALQNQTAQIQQKAQDELAKSSREIAIKTFDAEVEMVKFAIDSAIKLRNVAISAAGDYIKSIASSQKNSIELSMGKSSAQNGLISAVASFMNARANASDTVFKSELANANFTNDAHKASATLGTQLLTKKAEIAVAAADTTGRAAAAMLNNLHTSIGVSGQEQL